LKKGIYVFNKHLHREIPKNTLAFEPYYDILNTNLESKNVLKIKNITKDFLENY
jgi:hypothetical protein